jgi:hypothetical protein
MAGLQLERIDAGGDNEDFLPLGFMGLSCGCDDESVQG